jgi:predicted aspartyl protease
MPTFDFLYWTQEAGATLASSGPIIQVEIAMPRALQEFCTKKNVQIPPPHTGYALIDTGASVTAIDEEVLEQLSILPIDSIPSATPSGQGRSFVYPTSVSFPSVGIINMPLSRVIGCKLKWNNDGNKEIIMLLGRDLLQYMVLIYNGKGTSITLAF